MNYADYARQFLYPSDSLMIKSGLWLELEAVIGFVVGLGARIADRAADGGGDPDDRPRGRPDADPLPGAASPICRTCSAAVVGLATAHLAPGGLPVFGGGGGGPAGGGGESRTPAGVHHRGRLRHRRVAGGLVGPRRVADDDPGRLSRWRSRRPVAPEWIAGTREHSRHVGRSTPRGVRQVAPREESVMRIHRATPRTGGRTPASGRGPAAAAGTGIDPGRRTYRERR